MADNTTLNLGIGGDAIRDLARQGGATKTQVVQLDGGGSAANAENLITAGQQLMSNSLPVVLPYDMPIPPGDRIRNFLIGVELTIAMTPGGQFAVVPDIPFFLLGI